MPSIISTKTSGGGGIAVTGDTSGVLELASANGTTAVTISTGQVVSFVNNLGTVAGLPSYQCRAWVNFNGTGTVSIRASGNVSSITDNGTGDYTVNFTNAMPDANYNVVLGAGSTTTLSGIYIASGREAQASPTTSAYRLATLNFNAFADLGYVYAAFFR